MVNGDVRQFAKDNAVRFWEIAKEKGVSEATITRWMRNEFTEEERKSAIDLIKKIASTKKGDSLC